MSDEIPFEQKYVRIEHQYWTIAELREIWNWLEAKAISVHIGADVISPSDRFTYEMLKPHKHLFLEPNPSQTV